MVLSVPGTTHLHRIITWAPHLDINYIMSSLRVAAPTPRRLHYVIMWLTDTRNDIASVLSVYNSQEILNIPVVKRGVLLPDEDH